MRKKYHVFLTFSSRFPWLGFVRFPCVVFRAHCIAPQIYPTRASVCLLCILLTLVKFFPHRAIPITPAILLAIKHISPSFNSMQHSVFACALFLFFTLARAGSILPSSQKTPTHQFLTKDRVNFSKEGLLITLTHTKNIQFGRRRLHIPLLSSSSPLCPVAAYLASSSYISSHQVTPAFVFLHKDKIKWLTKSIFINVFRHLVNLAGIPDASGFTGHSFRRGGASWAFQAGVPGELIQVCGDWASDAYKKYLEFSMQNKLDLAALLMRNLPH